MKYCSRCKLNKDDVDFAKNQIWCRTCNKQYKDLWRLENKEDIKQYKHQYDITHTDLQKDYVRQYRQNNKESVAKNRRQYVNAKRISDPLFRLNQQISSVINKSLKKLGASKNGKSKSKYLPYSMQELKEHLEKQFEDWMNWNNQGVYNRETWNDDDSTTWKWNIDHIIPRSDLPYFSMEDDSFQKCWALSNLRPLSSKLNVIEGSRRVRHGRNNT